MKINFIAYTYSTKGKNPYTEVWDYSYLVPAVADQQGSKYNYIVVTCEPSKNGVYKYPAGKEYDTWMNGKTKCLYVPISDCKFCAFEDLPDTPYKKEIISQVKKQQKKWYEGKVKNRDYEYKNGKPSWML